MASSPSEVASSQKSTREIPAAVIRFAGDSGDGMQLAGTQFTDTSAIVGNDVATLPDFPAEIRAPAGTVAGVSGFQINFASNDIHTPGDAVNALIAMNPAAFKAHIEDTEVGGIVVVNESEFNKVNLRKAGFSEGYNPLDDEKYTQRFKLFKVPISRLNQEALKDSGLGPKDIDRCKNMYALGLIYWLYDRPLDTTIDFINSKFGRKNPAVAKANIQTLSAGYYFGETAEMFVTRYHVDKAEVKPGTYRKITGNEAAAMGLVAAGQLAGKETIYCSYPITPASDILHNLAAMRHYGVKTFQAEDEIAAVCAAIGVSFAGQLGVTGTSGPGLALKSEALGLAVMTELPLVVVNVQRGGPSTGLPTKTEQSDLLQTLFGRNGDCPLVVIAPQSPSDCFYATIEAARIAIENMVPVVVLSDGYIANGAEPWKLPSADSFKAIKPNHDIDPENFHTYSRNEKLARPWAIPGTKGLEHRIGGLEKAHITGNVSYDSENHQTMTDIRHQKIQRIADDLPELKVNGPEEGDLLLVGWGGTYGAIVTAAEQARKQGKKVSSIHIRHLSPMPRNLGSIFKKFKKVLVPELNMGQLRLLLRGKYLVDARGLNKVAGKPFLVEEITQAIDLMLSGQYGDRESLTPHNHAVSLDNQDVNYVNAGREKKAVAAGADSEG